MLVLAPSQLKGSQLVAHPFGQVWSCPQLLAAPSSSAALRDTQQLQDDLPVVAQSRWSSVGSSFVFLRYI
jgi:hypothetical protein